MAAVKDWITVNGQHIPIMNGQSKDEAIESARQRSEQYKRENDEKQRQIEVNKKQAEAKQKEEAQRELKSNLKFKDAPDFDTFIDNNFNELKPLARTMSMDDMRGLWYETRTEIEKQNIKEIDAEKALDTLREAIPPNVREGWFRSANSDYKPKLVDAVLSTKGGLNAALNVAYHNYRYQFERYSEVYGKWIPHEGVDQSKKLSFNDWLKTPQTMYRGDCGQKSVGSDVFASFTSDKKIAEKFLNEGAGGKLSEIQVRPIDTWGSYYTNAEEEYLIPSYYLKSRGK